jgi:spore coat polysaccharide biosynthesis protein SpsF
MTREYGTEQEAFWAGEFGDAYVARNDDPRRVAHRVALLARILARTSGVGRILELGANIGRNLLALRVLLPDAAFGAVEINDKAASSLERIPNTRVFRGSMLDFEPSALGRYELTLTSGVLIHVNPDRLPEAYRRLYECSTRYVLVIEYYNPIPVEVSYRGHARRLFKRDFAGEMLDRYRDIELMDYGFQYHRDPNFPADDCTWFLMKKGAAD